MVRTGDLLMDDNLIFVLKETAKGVICFNLRKRITAPISATRVVSSARVYFWLRRYRSA
jgi:hypothetical protein